MMLFWEFHPAPKPKHKRRKPKRKEQGRIRPEVAKRVWERDEGCCVLCGRTMPHVWTLELHHAIFRSQGGLGVEENLVLLCGPVTTSSTCHGKAHRYVETRKKIEDYLKKWYRIAEEKVSME